MPHKGSSTRIVWPCLVTIALLDACSFDESKLRRPATRDAASAVAMLADAAIEAGGGRRGDGPFSSPDASIDVGAGGATDGAAAGGVDGGLGGAGGSGGSSGADGGVDRTPGSGGQDGNEAGVLLPMDTAGPVDDGSANGADADEDAADAPSPEDAAADDRGAQPVDAPAETDAALDAGNGWVESDARDDTMSVDARGKKTCPASISGSIDRSDSTQIGRLSRVDSASVCGTAKEFPGNGADRTYSHLYDVYHFINVTSTPACFTFTLTFTNYRGLAVVAYSAFDPTDITAGYLGDAGDTLDSPQTIGITVGAGETIDVVVSAVAFGTDPAGAYTLACSTQ